MRLHASLYGKYNLGPWEFPKTNIFFCPQLDIFSDYVGGKFGTLAISAAMNGFAFGSHAGGFLIYPAVGLGLAIPASVYALTRVAATLWIDV